MSHARTIQSLQPVPARCTSSGHDSINDRCRFLLNERPPGMDAALALLPLAQEKWSQHVKARRALRAGETPARIARAETAFEACSVVAEAIIDAPMPRTMDGLSALSTAVVMAYEGCLDASDPVHNALWQLVCGVMMTIEGSSPPNGFETFSASI
ncbi:hypothetical protein MKK75_11465 [Methylobacterium sp. J-030]|uniref:hypothetical protein n=1 Tax=Methylobacterium sp. J-030 TaxID=2836627 RepID=UPI001FB9C231|nr:hypothetical protein [Methylobacterium sp. J-030]MCJ2069402.1 hypothetical protein [Methylobacterium sp. J-030]